MEGIFYSLNLLIFNLYFKIWGYFVIIISIKFMY
jgi:hypothetical protein